MRTNCTLFVLLAALASTVVAGGCGGRGRWTAGNDGPILTPFQMGRLAEQQDELPTARDTYEKLCRAEPRNAAAQHRLAVVLTRMGELEAALPHFQVAHELEPTNAEIVCDLGYNAFLQGEYATAETLLRLALEVDPRHERATNNLAIVVGRTGRTRESFELFRTFQSEAEAHANVAYLHVQRNEVDLAARHYDRALTLDPRLRSAASAAVEIAQRQPHAAPAKGPQFVDRRDAPPPQATVGRTRLASLDAAATIPPSGHAATPHRDASSIELVGGERPVNTDDSDAVTAASAAATSPKPSTTPASTPARATIEPAKFESENASRSGSRTSHTGIGRIDAVAPRTTSARRDEPRRIEAPPTAFGTEIGTEWYADEPSTATPKPAELVPGATRQALTIPIDAGESRSPADGSRVPLPRPVRPAAR
jgi:Tfp pilus assembly protein PilF